MIRRPDLDSLPVYLGGEERRLLDPEVAELVRAAEARGYQRGHADGIAAGRADNDRIGAGIASSLGTFADRVRDAHRTAAMEVVDAAIDIATIVLGHAPHDDGAALRDRVLAALDELDDDEVVVAVHPTDWAALSDAVGVVDGVAVETDLNLDPGEARVRGRWGAVDLTHDLALEAVRSALLDGIGGR